MSSKEPKSAFRMAQNPFTANLLLHMANNSNKSQPKAVLTNPGFRNLSTRDHGHCFPQSAFILI